MIEVKNLTVGYRNNEILKDVNINFKQNKITSIIGKNGCGKTTLLKTIARQLKLINGEILLCGKNISTFKDKEYAKKVSFLIQSRTTPQITVQNLVMYGRFPFLSFQKNYFEQDYRIVDNAMNATGISCYKDRMLKELSGGERQKVYIAMILAQDTEYILLDEPITFLDINKQLEVLELIKKLKEMGKTVITVMHDLQHAINISDNIVIIDNGNIAYNGTPLDSLKQMGETFNVEINKNKGFGFNLTN